MDEEMFHPSLKDALKLLRGQLVVDALAEQDDHAVTQTLYHYTDARGLRGILEGEAVWFTDYRHLNDPSEVAYGMNAAVELAAIPNDDLDGLVKLLLDMAADLMQPENFDDQTDFLTASFSERPDDLDQWRAYGDNGKGFSIGFAEDLFATDETEADEPVHVGRVIYDPQEIRRRYQQSFDHAAGVLGNILKQSRELLADKAVGIRFLRALSNELLATSWIWNSLTSKHHAYQNEREVRLIMLGPHERLHKTIKTRIRGNEIVPFIPHCMPLKTRGSIVEIIVGPAGHRHAERAVGQMLRELGYGEMPIRRSTIPYRPE